MIKVDQLTFTYPKMSLPTLKNLSFEIEKGEIFGFLGPSGAGKSTAQKIMYKIYHQYEGGVEIAGRNLKDWDNQYFEKIGVGFELPNHYVKLTGRENLALFASFYSNAPRHSAESLFDMVDLTTAIDQPVETYSKGMKMRLNFIRAIQHDPDILFFDEPTSGLDPVNAHRIKELIRELQSKGKTIFITTHSMETADELCHRVSFIVEGSLVMTGQPIELKKQYGRDVVQVELINGQNQEFSLKNLKNNAEFFSFLQQEEVKRIHTQEASLEAVFIEVTGQKLRQ